MKRSLIWVLTLSMAATLIGLISVQAYWIREALEVRDSQLRQAVNNALQQVVSELEAHETYAMLQNTLTLKGFYRNGPQTYGKFNYKYRTPQDSVNIEFRFSTDSTMVNTADANEIFLLRPDSLDEALFKLSTSGGESSPEKILYNKLNQLQEQTLKAIDHRQEKSIWVEQLIDKLLDEKIDMNERFDRRTLDNIIKKAFVNHGLNTTYAFAVKNQSDSILIFSDNYINMDSEHCYKVQLFPNDYFAEPTYLHMHLPLQRSADFDSFRFMASSSMVLVAIILFIFAITLYIIFKQKKLSEIKNDFVNNMTHELKTPISTVLLASQMLKDKSIPLEAKNIDVLTQMIEDESTRLSYQVEKVLQMAIFDKGHINLKIRQIDVNALIESVCENFQLKLKNRNAELILSLNAQKSLINADENHIKNVFFNLLDNAIKYSGENPKIEISTYVTKAGVCISVKDQGIGISRDNLKRIFDRFYRVPTGNLHDVKGFGLGLSYVKKILDEHKAEIKVESELNKGSVFSMTFPMATSA